MALIFANWRHTEWKSAWQ